MRTNHYVILRQFEEKIRQILRMPLTVRGLNVRVIEIEKTKNNDMKNISFASAVLIVMNEFADKNSKFSAYDVTQRLRDMVNNGEAVLHDGEQDNVGGNLTYVIDHARVRAFMRELDQFQILDLDKEVASVNGNSFVNYSFKSDKGAPQTVPQFQQVVPQSAPVAQSLSGDIIPKIKAYLDRKLAMKQAVTLGDIQARLKTPGLTVRDIGTIIHKEGYKLNLNQVGYSYSEVTK